MRNNEVNQLGGVAHQIESTRDNPQRYRVYSMFGISPALNTMQGGGLSPYWLVRKNEKIFSI